MDNNETKRSATVSGATEASGKRGFITATRQNLPHLCPKSKPNTCSAPLSFYVHLVKSEPICNIKVCTKTMVVCVLTNNFARTREWLVPTQKSQTRDLNLQ
ncbi:hypothetical protein L596_003358 [Steinernema carpocapsae]|uniref:Uncharacterized protein n=1 Tax=Steinernema carpocapsae TaxID=34508 RepID=A0A4U8USB5_STECR|nr:hypothetical protein L596_003358 [Steinernema carpocapsae]